VYKPNKGLTGNEIGAGEALAVHAQGAALHFQLHEFPVEALELFRLGRGVQALQLAHLVRFDPGDLQLEKAGQNVAAIPLKRFGRAGGQWNHGKLGNQALERLRNLLPDPFHPGHRVPRVDQPGSPDGGVHS